MHYASLYTGEAYDKNAWKNLGPLSTLSNLKASMPTLSCNCDQCLHASRLVQLLNNYMLVFSIELFFWKMMTTLRLWTMLRSKYFHWLGLMPMPQQPWLVIKQVYYLQQILVFNMMNIKCIMGIPCGFISPLKGFSAYGNLNYAIRCGDVSCKSNSFRHQAIEAAKNAEATYNICWLRFDHWGRELEQREFNSF